MAPFLLVHDPRHVMVQVMGRPSTWSMGNFFFNLECIIHQSDTNSGGSWIQSRLAVESRMHSLISIEKPLVRYPVQASYLVSQISVLSSHALWTLLWFIELISVWWLTKSHSPCDMIIWICLELYNKRLLFLNQIFAFIALGPCDIPIFIWAPFTIYKFNLHLLIQIWPQCELLLDLWRVADRPGCGQIAGTSSSDRGRSVSRDTGLLLCPVQLWFRWKPRLTESIRYRSPCIHIFQGPARFVVGYRCFFTSEEVRLCRT